MDDETRTALAALDSRMEAGFARMDRYFELQQAQFVEFRTEVRAEFREVHAQLAALTRRVERLELEVDRVRGGLDSLRQEVRALRDRITRELADLKLELGALQRTSPEAPAAYVQRDIEDLRARVERLEQRLPATEAPRRNG